MKIETLFVESTKTVPYNPEQHKKDAKKFLLFKQTNTFHLFTGNFDWHTDLKDAIEFSGEYYIVGAGTIYSKIIEWHSSGLQVETPNKYKQPIQQALGISPVNIVSHQKIC